ncbi:MAG: dienelactone hydrolase family protein [Simkaniaceae bacterium]|nr:MAG: dienelactone hydrolase family protein [Simkaniaceae bacterium]
MNHIIKLFFIFLSTSLFAYVGQQNASIIDEKRNRPIEMIIWYPTQSSEGINEGTVWIQPDVAIDAPVEIGKHPLILLSHGWGGEKIELMWLAEKLVKKGYIVASIDHYGNTWKDYSEEISIDYWHRPLDISQTLDFLIQDSPITASIDQDRIGFAGFSMGGLTGLWLAGGEINQASYKDPRIRAFFLMAPRGKDFSQSSIESITAPLLIVSGEEDKVLPYKDNGKYISEHAPQSHFELLKGEVGHPIFLNCPSKIGKENLAAEIIEDPPSIDRGEIHRKVSQMAIHFFSENL